LTQSHEGEIVFCYETAHEALEHLKKSGAGTAYYDAVDPTRRDFLETRFLKRLIAHADKENLWAPVDCAIALTYLELAAKAHGLGSCWAGLLTRAVGLYAPAAEFLNLPDSNKVYGAVMLGYPKYRYQRIPKRNDIKVKWL
jgi:nitroreductase